jgi:hypothetical protein
MQRVRIPSLLIVVASAISALSSLWAQAPEGAGAAKAKGKGKAVQAEAAPAPAPVPQVLRLVRPSTYLVTGHGSNSTFRVTPAGVILVDTKLPNPGDHERLVELIRGVTGQPVKFVISTNNKPASSGNNGKFQVAGAEVVTGDRKITLGGVETQVMRVGDAIVVFFPDAKLVAIGDLRDPNTLSVDWTLAIPSEGEPRYRGK